MHICNKSKSCESQNEKQDADLVGHPHFAMTAPRNVALERLVPSAFELPSKITRIRKEHVQQPRSKASRFSEMTDLGMIKIPEQQMDSANGPSTSKINCPAKGAHRVPAGPLHLPPLEAGLQWYDPHPPRNPALLRSGHAQVSFDPPHWCKNYAELQG